MRNQILFCVLMCSGLLGWAQVQKGVDIIGAAADDNAGKSVSMPDQNTLAVSSPRNDDNGVDAGHVRIYRWNGNAWIQKGNAIVGETAGEESGTSVSMPDSNTVAIGASLNDDAAANAGQVRVYRWNGNSWLQKGGDLQGDAAGDFSGYAISMPDSNTLAVGALGHNLNTGLVRVYEWNGTTWVQKGIDLIGTNVDDYFGQTVCMPNASTLAIGATGADSNGADAGSVLVYTWNGNSWVQKGSDIIGEVTGDWSGEAVNMPDANTIAIGTHDNDENGSNAGHTRIFIWNGSSWVQKGADIDGETPGEWSGSNLSMATPDVIAIGARYNDENGIDAGLVRIYRWNGTSWVQFLNDINGLAAFDNAGYAVVMADSSTIAVGAPTHDGNGVNAGHARVFDLPITTGVDCCIEGKMFSAYPNPAQDFIKVSLPVHSIVSITDVAGRVLSTETIPQDGMLSVQHLTTGIYFVTDVKTGRSLKLMKQ